MASVMWDIERFSAKLTSALVAALAGGPEIESLQRAVAESAAAAEDACGLRPMACAAGCPYCCVLTVATLLPEGMIIADWLRRRHPEALGEIRERIAAHRRQTRWMDDEARIFAHVPCPLLDAAGSCSIHPVRPLVCRGAASLDRDRCREALRPMVPDPEECIVPVDLLRQMTYDAAFVALAEALAHHGLDDRGIELGAGLLAFLDRPEVSELFLQGQRLPRALWEDW
jgi:hypothetical protein